jgi:alkylation response protein AidB-like acyl-CoA dehydrogenase
VDFTEEPDHRAIRAAVREVCAASRTSTGERYWREARLMRIAPVPQEMVLNYLAEHVLGLPRSY